MAYKTVKLNAVTVTNEQGTFHVFTVEPGRVTKDNELEKAYGWYGTIRHKSVAVAGAAENDEDVPF